MSGRTVTAADFRPVIEMRDEGEPDVPPAVREQVALYMSRLIERAILEGATGTATTCQVEQPKRYGDPTFSAVRDGKPLTEERLVKGMAEAVFDAEVIITAHAPAETTGADGIPQPVAAFVIERHKLPGWPMECAVAAARGEPPPKPRLLVFPNVEMALAAISAATARKGKDIP